MTSSPTAIVQPALHALTQFFRLEAAGGILLILAATLALLCANSPLAGFYEAFQHLPVVVRVGEFGIAKPLLMWINDGLMAIFFLLVALEIKREKISGELAGGDKLVLPLVCAIAGVAVPALIYAWLNRADAESMRGWAVPTATDIAFALGVLALLGSRVPVGMKLLLSTIAVVDDLIAIVIIALFYSHGLSPLMLALAAIALIVMLVLNRRGVTALTPYMLLGTVLWVCVLKSGVHATLAGVATGLLIPHKAASADDRRGSPLEYLEHALHPWVAFAILPVFAFANAGLPLGNLQLADLTDPLPLGVLLGLVFGKPVGIVCAALLLAATGKVRLPDGMDARSTIGLGMLCGIGFTMSLFIASLAFEEAQHYGHAVLGILAASVLSAVVGYAWLRVTLPREGMAAR